MTHFRHGASKSFCRWDYVDPATGGLDRDRVTWTLRQPPSSEGYPSKRFELPNAAALFALAVATACSGFRPELHLVKLTRDIDAGLDEFRIAVRGDDLDVELRIEFSKRRQHRRHVDHRKGSSKLASLIDLTGVTLPLFVHALFTQFVAISLVVSRASVLTQGFPARECSTTPLRNSTAPLLPSWTRHT